MQNAPLLLAAALAVVALAGCDAPPATGAALTAPPIAAPPPQVAAPPPETSLVALPGGDSRPGEEAAATAGKAKKGAGKAAGRPGGPADQESGLDEFIRSRNQGPGGVIGDILSGGDAAGDQDGLLAEVRMRDGAEWHPPEEE